MDHLLAGPCFGSEFKNVPDAQCQKGGFDEFLIPDRDELASAAVGGGGGKARTRKTGGRTLRWLTSCLALAGPCCGLV
jgi:hypothetical protein